jgi:hypothetical protein
MRTPYLPLAITLAATMFASSANAQSSYAMTTLSAPSSSLGFVATGMDNTGKVVGFQQMRNGSIFASPGDIGTLFQCPFGCPAYTARAVTWPAGTATSAAATLGETYLAATHINERGSLLGFVVQESTKKVTLQASVTPTRPGNYRTLFMGRDSDYAAIGGPRSSIYPFVPYGLLPNDTIYGGQDAGWSFALVDNLPDVVLPAVIQNKVVSRVLVTPPYVTGRYTAMNSVGDAAGQVSTTENTGWVPAFWQAGNFSLMNMPAAYEPLSMNNARQVLMQKPAPDGQASVWFNGTASAINGNGKRVFASAMNSSGTVVGCTQNIVANPTRADNTAFIWMNGVLQDLSQVLSSKGVKLPSGTRLGCPVAINDSGSILAYYYRTASTNTVTWVRFTAKP